ncbi:hypothetical protein Desor_3810 [Desulfosporosinus orientis DSM 765]|uniref:Uncharacterized protein n=2 Tax=Desulfosporosinus orientis TaxID=1563 RepID=G7W9D3_DESOD|nr:hypothetical protein Desor_3810 [Desulfosporosinus orientis DSM 765]
MHTPSIQEKKSQSKVNVKLCGFIFLIAILLFSLGINFLKTDVFTHYYNPDRHQIVEQDKDTMTIYAWKDSAGNIYTPSDSEVEYFPYGISALIIALLISGTVTYSLLTRKNRNVVFDKDILLRN